MSNEELKTTAREILELAVLVHRRLLDSTNVGQFLRELQANGVEAPAAAFRAARAAEEYQQVTGQTMHTRELVMTLQQTAAHCLEEATRLEQEPTPELKD